MEPRRARPGNRTAYERLRSCCDKLASSGTIRPEWQQSVEDGLLVAFTPPDDLADVVKAQREASKPGRSVESHRVAVHRHRLYAALLHGVLDDHPRLLLPLLATNISRAKLEIAEIVQACGRGPLQPLGPGWLDWLRARIPANCEPDRLAAAERWLQLLQQPVSDGDEPQPQPPRLELPRAAASVIPAAALPHAPPCTSARCPGIGLLPGPGTWADVLGDVRHFSDPTQVFWTALSQPQPADVEANLQAWDRLGLARPYVSMVAREDEGRLWAGGEIPSLQSLREGFVASKCDKLELIRNANGERLPNSEGYRAFDVCNQIETGPPMRADCLYLMNVRTPEHLMPPRSVLEAIGRPSPRVPEAPAPSSLNVTPAFTYVDVHYDYGRHELAVQTGGCRKLWLMHPPTNENLQALEAYLGGPHPDGEDGDDKARPLPELLQGVMVMTESPSVVYMPPGTIHAVLTIAGGMLQGYGWSNADCLTWTAKYLDIELRLRAGEDGLSAESYRYFVRAIQACRRDASTNPECPDTERLRDEAEKQVCRKYKLLKTRFKRSPRSDHAELTEMLGPPGGSCASCGNKWRLHKVDNEGH